MNVEGPERMDLEGGTGHGHSVNPDHYYPQLQYPQLEHTCTIDDWNYRYRRTSQEIIPGLFLGPYAVATKHCKESMLQAGITHVVCVRSPIEAQVIRTNHPDTFKYLVVELNDNMFQGIIPQLKGVIGFLDDCFKTGGRALVHGNAGMCSSAAMVVGYVMWHYGVDAKEAFKYVQNKRFCISINDNFMSQLIDFESVVRAIHDVTPMTTGSENDRKRQMEEGEYENSAMKRGTMSTITE